MKAKMPNFLIIGTGKAGTTSLHHYLDQHPQIYMSPKKEPNFFALEGQNLDFRGPYADILINRHSVSDIKSYQALFDGVTNERIIGEASPLYLYSPKAPERIRYYIPNVKLIAILRNPVDRAYSAYIYLYGWSNEPVKDFSLALRLEKERIKKGWEWIWHYKNMGLYYEQLKRYFDLFRKEQIKIHLYEDFKFHPTDVLKDIFSFLDVDDTFIPVMRRKYAQSSFPKNQTLHALLSRPNPFKSIFKPFIPEEVRRSIVGQLRNRNLGVSIPALSLAVRKQLLKEYREDILKLQGLINRDLSRWLKLK